MATVKVKCRFCAQTSPVMKHGHSPRGIQRYRCLACKRSFLLDYAYEACKPGVKEKIVDMAMNSAGLRDTGRVLNVGYNTVLRTLKNSNQGKWPPFHLMRRISNWFAKSMNNGRLSGIKRTSDGCGTRGSLGLNELLLMHLGNETAKHLSSSNVCWLPLPSISSVRMTSVSTRQTYHAKNTLWANAIHRESSGLIALCALGWSV